MLNQAELRKWDTQESNWDILRHFKGDWSQKPAKMGQNVSAR